MAAADSGQYGEQPEEELELAIECDRWNSLPYSGGYLDQPAGLMDRMRTLLNVYRAFKSMTETKMNMQEWSEAYPAAWQIVGQVEALRRRLDG